MTSVLNIVLLSLAGLSMLAAAYFIAKGLGARSSIHRQAYSVGQVEARRTSQVNWIRAGVFLLAGLIFLGVFLIRPLVGGLSPAEAPTPQATPAPVQSPQPTTQIAPTEALAQPSPTGQPAGEPATPTTEATAAPTETPTPQTATVSSGVGVWLRGAPGTSGEQLEWLLDGTVVTLLAGQQTTDALLWQQVRTDAGLEGWVAMDFLTVNP